MRLRSLYALRIPGQWSYPKELFQRLPAGCRLTGETLIRPDATQVAFGAVRADDQFAQIFRSSCRQPLTQEEQAAVDGYSVNVLLSGPGGSMPAARTRMQAATAVVRAGGLGVFIDNSTLAHGGRQWLELAEEGGSDALSFAFVALVGSRTDVWTMGMHVLGLRDGVMKRADLEADDFSGFQTLFFWFPNFSGSQTLFGNCIRETLFRVYFPRYRGGRETEFRGRRVPKRSLGTRERGERGIGNEGTSKMRKRAPHHG